MLPAHVLKSIQKHRLLAAGLLAYFFAIVVVFWPGFYSEGALKYIFAFQATPTDSCLHDWRGFLYPCLLKTLYQQDILLGYFFVLQTVFITLVVLGTLLQLRKISPWGALISWLLFLFLPINFKMQSYIDRNVLYCWLIWAGCLCLFVLADLGNSKKKQFVFHLFTFTLFLAGALIRREGYFILALFIFHFIFSFKSSRFKILFPCLIALAVFIFSEPIKNRWPSLFLSDNYSLNVSLNTYHLLIQETNPQLTEQQKSVVSAILPDEPHPPLQNNFKNYQISWPSLKPDLTTSKVQPFQRLVFKLCLDNLYSCVKIKTFLFYKFLASSPLFDPADNRKNFRFEHSESVLKSVRTLSQNHRSNIGVLDHKVWGLLYNSQTGWPSLLSFWGAIGVFFISLTGTLRARTLKVFWPVYAQFFAVYLFGSLGQMKYLYLIHIYFIAFAPSTFLVLLQTLKERILKTTFPKKNNV